MSDFKIGDTVKISVAPFKGEIGRIVEIESEYDSPYIVKINLKTKDKYCLNNYSKDELSLIDDGGLSESSKLTFFNDVHKVDSIYCDPASCKKEVKKKVNKVTSNSVAPLKLDEEELGYWMSDSDANYWSQEINESNEVPIRDVKNNIIATYNFSTNLLSLNESLNKESDDFPKYEKETDFIADYVHKYSEGENEIKVASWEFVSKIAIAENLPEKYVLKVALTTDKYKVFCIEGYNYEKLIVASKAITKKDIYNDYAGFLEGSVVVKEVK